MKTNYSIPQKELDEIVKRDTDCVYCHKNWDSKNKGDSASIEHLNHLLEWDSVGCFTRENKPIFTIIAICCGSCNSSRGAKSLRSWFETPYCNERKIGYSTVASVVKNYIDKYEKEQKKNYQINII